MIHDTLSDRIFADGGGPRKAWRIKRHYDSSAAWDELKDRQAAGTFMRLVMPVT